MMDDMQVDVTMGLPVSIILRKIATLEIMKGKYVNHRRIKELKNR